MFQFPAFASYPYVFEGKIPYINTWKPKPFIRTAWILQVFKVGCPIRRSMDQSLFAAPHGLSQRITSFFACACQGIHQMPLKHLFVLIVYAHPYLQIWNSYPSRLRSKGFQIGLTQPEGMRKTSKNLITFYNQIIS